MTLQVGSLSSNNNLSILNTCRVSLLRGRDLFLVKPSKRAFQLCISKRNKLYLYEKTLCVSDKKHFVFDAKYNSKHCFHNCEGSISFVNKS